MLTLCKKKIGKKSTKNEKIWQKQKKIDISLGKIEENKANYLKMFIKLSKQISQFLKIF